MRKILTAAGCLVAFATGLAAPAPAQDRMGADNEYRGMCDASAAFALDRARFAVANDEDSVLRIYRRGTPEPTTVDLHALLDVSAGTSETDIEGAALIDGTVFLIASHGRNSKGEHKADRHRLAAMRMNPADLRTTRVGKPYAGLLADLEKAPGLTGYALGTAAGKAAESDGGLNIEGLAAGPDGTLLIGFRNPIPGGKALIVPLLNPMEVVAEGKTARFGAPVELPLGGLGIRSIDAWGAGGYVIVAGPHGNGDSFKLFRWSGQPGAAPAELPLPTALPATFHPEAVFSVPGEPNTLMLLSDDGDIKITVGNKTKECKKFEETPQHQRFRARLIAF